MSPTSWVPYLDMMLEVYKEVHPDKTQGRIFGNSDHGSKDAMDVDSAEGGRKKKSDWKKRKEGNWWQ